MKKCTIFLLAFSIIIFSSQCSGPEPQAVQHQDAVTVDYRMAEAAIAWLEYVETEPGLENIRQRFMTDVATTEGCQAIIHHWERFREWDEETFLTFILEALGEIPSTQALENEDGTLTSFGRRVKLWTYALKNTIQLRKDLNLLKKAGVRDTALELARKYLPEDADISNQFYVVLFGASSAFSVGEENGFDLLQLPKRPSGEIFVENVIETFAHEMHHSGFSNCTKKHMTDLENEDRIMLAALLAAEGMPTHFINRMRENLPLLRASTNELHQMLAVQWEKNLARLSEFYAMAERDIQRNIDGEIGQQEIFETWMSGLQGPAYVLGSDMFAVIEENLGLEEAKKIAQDCRQLLSIYNRAAEKANDAGGNYFVYNAELAQRLQQFTGTDSHPD
jgi:hypothetical protein